MKKEKKAWIIVMIIWFDEKLVLHDQLLRFPCLSLSLSLSFVTLYQTMLLPGRNKHEEAQLYFPRFKIIIAL